jgi:hypothetical protein
MDINFGIQLQALSAYFGRSTHRPLYSELAVALSTHPNEVLHENTKLHCCSGLTPLPL